VAGVTACLLRTERHKVSLVGAIRQFCFDLSLATAQQERFDAPVQLIQVSLADRASAFIQIVKIAVEAKERAENRWIEE
jgi:hypothetical protein